MVGRELSAMTPRIASVQGLIDSIHIFIAYYVVCMALVLACTCLTIHTLLLVWRKPKALERTLVCPLTDKYLSLKLRLFAKVQQKI